MYIDDYAQSVQLYTEGFIRLQGAVFSMIELLFCCLRLSFTDAISINEDERKRVP